MWADPHMSSRRRAIREYLRRKEEEETALLINKKKEAIRSAYASDSRIPHEMKDDAQEVLSQIIYDIHDTPDEKPLPRVLVTTSRDPSSMLREFSKRVSLVFNGRLLSRGSMTLHDLHELCVTSKVTALVLLGESHGRPSSVSFTFFPAGPAFSFSVTGHRMVKTNKFSTMVGLVMDGFEGDIGARTRTFFSLLFPKEKEYKRYVLIANEGESFVLKHFNKEEDLSLEMRLYEIKCGEFGETEWTSRSFINTNREKTKPNSDLDRS